MLTEVADGVLVHESTFMKSNLVVVRGEAGVLLIDPGIVDEELVALADDLDELGQPVVAGFSTHPHWDHLLWHERLGSPPRYATARCASAIQSRLSDPNFRAMVASMIPADIVDDVPLDLLGQVTGLPPGATVIPWDGPAIRIIEHDAHAPGHAALLVEERRVLVAGDMVSDVLIPMLNLRGTEDPIDDYLSALRLLEGAAGDVEVFIPGHGSIGRGEDLPGRIAEDRAYLDALRDGEVLRDPRLSSSAYGRDFLPDVHDMHVQHLA